MGTFAIRPAGPQDHDALGLLAEHNGLFPASLLAGMIAPFLAGDSEVRWLVAEDENGLMGFLYCDAEIFTEGTHNLRAMATVEDARRRGVGSALVAHLEDMLRQADQRILLVETSSAAAFKTPRDFYAKRGFRLEATIRGFWAEGDDKLVFLKAL